MYVLTVIPLRCDRKEAQAAKEILEQDVFLHAHEARSRRRTKAESAGGGKGEQGKDRAQCSICFLLKTVYFILERF